jgi:hypothetical protein
LSNFVLGTGVQSWWYNNEYQIAFCRGGKGFIAFNKQFLIPYDDDKDLKTTLQVNMAANSTLSCAFRYQYQDVAILYHSYAGNMGGPVAQSVQ